MESAGGCKKGLCLLSTCYLTCTVILQTFLNTTQVPGSTIGPGDPAKVKKMLSCLPSGREA